MEIEEILIKKKKLQSILLTFIENNGSYENFEEFTKFISFSNVLNNKQDSKDLFYMILHIANNH